LSGTTTRGIYIPEPTGQGRRISGWAVKVCQV